MLHLFYKKNLFKKPFSKADGLAGRPGPGRIRTWSIRCHSFEAMAPSSRRPEKGAWRGAFRGPVLQPRDSQKANSTNPTNPKAQTRGAPKSHRGGYSGFYQIYFRNGGAHSSQTTLGISLNLERAALGRFWHLWVGPFGNLDGSCWFATRWPFFRWRLCLDRSASSGFARWEARLFSVAETPRRPRSHRAASKEALRERAPCIEPQHVSLGLAGLYLGASQNQSRQGAHEEDPA
ncbi:hypothetical protein M885DRAFT_289880 [Pelagophyceae sp. CCMP2097]|nr:hypothetical protein M885DRAFT_289880 [Pelagophyceae sp. CCMP2097]|mmetsp:Transcript_24558/g.84759  ORF Transcript_24558/g.84759 Transcript_24558/m.84759 type:complete len:234 (-) Transcript_24558:270-971(-)